MVKRRRAGWLFMLPSLAGVLVFYLIPFGDVVRRSFLRTAGDSFAGLDNYKQVFANQAFRLRGFCPCFKSCLPGTICIAQGTLQILWPWRGFRSGLRRAGGIWTRW